MSCQHLENGFGALLRCFIILEAALEIQILLSCCEHSTRNRQHSKFQSQFLPLKKQVHFFLSSMQHKFISFKRIYPSCTHHPDFILVRRKFDVLMIN